MTPSRFLKGFLVSLVLFTLLDAVWHGGIMAGFYQQRLMLMNPGTAVALVSFSPFILFVEAINAAALTYFVLHRQSADPDLSDAAWVGAFLGFTMSGTVNFLNHALIPEWDIVMAWVDTTWGTIAGCIAGIAVAALCGEHRRRGIFRLFSRK